MFTTSCTGSRALGHFGINNTIIIVRALERSCVSVKNDWRRARGYYIFNDHSLADIYISMTTCWQTTSLIIFMLGSMNLRAWKRQINKHTARSSREILVGWWRYEYSQPRVYSTHPHAPYPTSTHARYNDERRRRYWSYGGRCEMVNFPTSRTRRNVAYRRSPRSKKNISREGGLRQ